MWNRISRSAPGCRARRPAPAASTRTRTASVSSDRKKIAPSSRSCSSAVSSSGHRGRSSASERLVSAVSRAVSSVMGIRRSLGAGYCVTDDVDRAPRPTKERHHDRLSPAHPRRADGPRSVRQRPWYEALLDAEPVLDEDTDPNCTTPSTCSATARCSGCTSTSTPAPAEQFSEFRVGLDHVAFGCADRDELEKWAAPPRRARHRPRRHQGRGLRLGRQLPRPRRHRARVLRPAGVTS